MVRTKKGLMISDRIDPIHCMFIILASSDFESFYYHMLMWLVQISDDPGFEEKWKNAKTEDALRLIIIDSWEKRLNPK